MKNKLATQIMMVLIVLLGIVSPIVLSKLGTTYNYIINPISWILAAIITYKILPSRSKRYNFKKEDVRQLALIGALVFIIFYFGIGIVIGYAKSPFDRSLLGIIKNMWIIISVVIAKEVIRDVFIKTTTRYKQWFTLIFITTFFVIAEIRIDDVTHALSSVDAAMNFITKDLLIAIVNSCFLTYLAYRDGIKSSLLFILPQKLIFLIAPVFPTNVFIVLLLIETIVPLIIYLKIEKTYNYNRRFGVVLESDLKTKMSHAFYVVILLFILAFTTGLLPYSPIVVITNSMFPLIERGDMVITKKIAYEDIKINDIIEYKLNNILVIHRVLEIKQTYNGRVLITKGDNNRSQDAKYVTADQIKGLVVLNIPKVGYPTLWLRDIIGGINQNVEVETGN